MIVPYDSFLNDIFSHLYLATRGEDVSVSLSHNLLISFMP